MNSNKVAILLDYYNLNQDVCLASIETLKEGFLETQKELLKKLNADLEEIAKKKFEEYQRELEEVCDSLVNGSVSFVAEKPTQAAIRARF